MSGSLVIMTTAAIRFHNEATNEAITAQNGFAGEVPEWVSATREFSAGMEEGLITVLARTDDNPVTAKYRKEAASRKGK